MKSWRLEKYYFVIQISGIVVLLLFLLGVVFFPEQFRFFGSAETFIMLTSTWLLGHIVLFALHIKYGRRIFFSFSRYLWVTFFSFLILVSGGSESPLLYLLIFPLLVAGVDLDKRDVRVTGFMVSGFFVYLFIRDYYTLGGEGFGWRLFNLVVFTVIALYIYMMVADTIRSRSEREKIKAELDDIIKFDRIKRDFITVASHRLRSPLTAIKWAIEEGDKIEAEKLVNESIGVVNELLKTLEYNERDIKLNKFEINLVTVTKRILSDLGSLSRSKKVKVDLVAPENLQIIVDERIFVVALHHLVENAIKYSPGGEVRVLLHCDEKVVTIEIKDTGIGIAPEDMIHVFEQFFRSKEAVKLEPNSSGIGLYTAKKIVEIHHGTIELKSDVGIGTSVIVRLPLVLTRS